MSKKNKVLVLIILIFILFLILNIVLKEKRVKYSIDKNSKKFLIIETKKDKYIKINVEINKTSYSFDLYNVNKKEKKIVTDIYYYKNKSYECLLPIINSKVYSDMVCYKNNYLYNYHDIVGENKDLDEYVSNISIYNKNKYDINVRLSSNISGIKHYDLELDKNYSMTTYKGINIDGTEIDIFKNDVYTNKINGYVLNYYFTADYDNNYEFSYFYIVDLITKKVHKIKSDYVISLDSYVQGIVDNKVYIYDTDNEKQYEFDVEHKKIKLIYETQVRFYKNQRWEYISFNKANNEMYFEYNANTKFDSYENVIESENYYYLFKKRKDEYILYRSDKDNLNILKQIVTLNTLDIKYNDEYIYYIDGDQLYFYSDETGKKIILENSELDFNKNIKYYIY